MTDSHIGNSRDTSFEDMIRKETNGKGVDMVLNSLSDEKLQVHQYNLRILLILFSYNININ